MCCSVVSIFAPRYYRLLEKEQKIFLGLKGIDSLAAREYIELDSPTERAKYYEKFWQDKKEEDRQEFEARADYAFYQFGRFAPLSDNRIPIYVKHGPPSKREEISPEKKIAVKTKEVVNPAEVWTYKKYGIIFDFVRFTRAYQKIAQSEFGDRVKIPHFSEMAIDSLEEIESPALLQFNLAIGRFRQKKNLTRLELYVMLNIEDTTGVSLSRIIRIFNKKDSIIKTRKSLLIPQNSKNGYFYDQVNFWLVPEEYRLDIEFIDSKNNRVGKKIMWINLIDYQNDTKEISDLVPAILIDNAFTHEKFNKPVGRVIPLTESCVPVHQPFYFYAEVYNLETKNGMHRIKTTYEVTNKAKMRREIVDVMIKDQIEAGDVAYLAAHYHPMDLLPGEYIITLKVKDLLSGKERTAISEFELMSVE